MLKLNSLIDWNGWIWSTEFLLFINLLLWHTYSGMKNDISYLLDLWIAYTTCIWGNACRKKPQHHSKSIWKGVQESILVPTSALTPDQLHPNYPWQTLASNFNGRKLLSFPMQRTLGPSDPCDNKVLSNECKITLSKNLLLFQYPVEKPAF